MKKFLSIGFTANVHIMQEKPKEDGWYIVRSKPSDKNRLAPEGQLGWCFYFNGKWNWQEDLSEPADETRLLCWHTPSVSGMSHNLIAEL